MGNTLGQAVGMECCTQVLTIDPNDLSEEDPLMNDAAKQQSYDPEQTPNTPNDNNNITPTANNRKFKKNSKRSRRSSISSSSRSNSGSNRSKTKGYNNTPTGEANYHYSPIAVRNNNNDIPSSDDDEMEEVKNIDEIEGIDINNTELTKTDHEMDEWFKKQNAKKKRKNSKKPKRNKLKKLRSKKSNSNKQTIDDLQDELSEIEIKLKQQLHEAEILKQENNALRQENYVLKSSSIQASQQNAYHVTNTKTIKHSSQIPPTPPIQPYRMRSMKTNSFSPEVRAVDPVTISITNTTVSYQGSVKRMPSLELGAEQIDINQLPGISPMVSQLPPMYGDMFSLTEEPNGTVDIDSLQTPTTRLGPINTQSSTLTPSSESSISQTQRASPILTYITNHDVMANDTDDSLDLGDHDQNIATNDGHGHSHKHEDSEEDKLLFKMGFNNGKCSGIDGCISCKRIIKALEWYYVYRDDTELLLKKINEHQYGIYLLHDYQHIMAYHLSIKSYTNNSNGNDVEAQYERIRSLISHECDSNDCKGFKRHKSRHVQSTNDVIIETMDQAHCYFLHLDDEI